MNIIFIVGTLGLITFLYWSAYQSEKLLKTIELTGNLLLSLPEFIFKVILLGLCLGLISSLNVQNPEKYFGWPSNSPALDVVIGAAIGLVTQFGVNIASFSAIKLFGKSIYSPAIMKSVVPNNPREWILIIIPLLLAVTIEEVLFRSMLIGGFSIVVNPWLMAAASSIIFGIMHSPQGKLGVGLTGVVGFILAATFIITQSLVVVISAHYIINFLQILRAKEDLSWLERFEKAPGKTQT